MAKKYNQYPEVYSLGDDDLFLISQAPYGPGTTKKIKSKPISDVALKAYRVNFEVSDTTITLANPITHFIEVNFAAEGQILKLPPMNEINSLGGGLLFIQNASGFTGNVQDNAGDHIITNMRPGDISISRLEKNNTAAGIIVGRTLGTLGQENIDGAVITGGRILNTKLMPPKIEITSNITLTDVHGGCILLFNSATPFTATYAASSTLYPEYSHRFFNAGAGTVTLAVSGSDSIVGSTSITSGQSGEIIMMPDGANHKFYRF